MSLPTVLENRPTTAFADAEEEFPVYSTGASAFAEGSPRRRDSSDSASDAEWWRWLAAKILSEERPSKADIQRFIQEFLRFQEFRAKFDAFLGSDVGVRGALRLGVAEFIRTTPFPSIYIQGVLRRCTSDGVEGLDMGIDLLKEFGKPLQDVFDEFVNQDRKRWTSVSLSNHVNDDVCYVLLRALARSSLPIVEKLPRIDECLHGGTASIREAATHALGDLGGDEAERLLKQAIDQDSDSMVRESAKEALDDLNS